MPKPPRTHIPAERRREVEVEAGYRCAIPTCKQVPTEVHHIDGDRTNHSFENLILLCSNDHKSADAGRIERKAIVMFKRNLGLITGRYGDLERRLLGMFADKPDERQVTVDRSADFEFLYLLQDGLLRVAHREVLMRIGDFTQGPVVYELTDDGAEFVRRWREGKLIEGS